MKRREQILLDYVIKKSYSEEEAQNCLDFYDSERTGIELSAIKLINSLIRHGNTALARKFLLGAIDEKKQCSHSN
jgi:hypothetical protein